MKPKTMILIGVAIACGLGASYMTSRLLAERSAAKDVPVNTVKVLIAKKRVPPFEQIKNPENFFDEKDVPEGTYPSKCLKSFDDIRNQRLAKAKSEEEAVYKEDILTQSQSGIYQNLPEGQRAVAMQVNPVSLVGGFVLPGCRVDLIGTAVNNSGEVTADTIMQNMLVLAVDQKTDRTDVNSMLGSTVTFACTLEESQRLAVASKALDLRLVLRSPADHGKQNLAQSRTGDWKKPLSDGGRVGETSEDGSGDTTAPGSLLGKGREPKAPAVETLVVAPKSDEVKAEPVAPAPAAVVKHTLLIENGEYVQKAVFVKNEDGTWGRPGGEQEEESPSRSKPTKTTPPVPPTPALPAGPADATK